MLDGRECHYECVDRYMAFWMQGYQAGIRDGEGKKINEFRRGGVGMTWVYVRGSDGPGRWLYTVGYFMPDGTWQPDSDWNTREEAQKQVHYLNGGVAEKTNGLGEVA